MLGVSAAVAANFGGATGFYGVPANAYKPLRTITNHNRQATGRSQNTGSNRYVCYIPVLITQDSHDIGCAWPAFYLANNNLGNDYTVQEAAWIAPNNTAVQITFDNGANTSKLVANGTAELLNDFIPAASFGYNKIAEGTIYFLKFTLSMSAGAYIPACLITVSDLSSYNAMHGFYTSGSTTMSATVASGPYTKQSGADLVAPGFMFAPMVIGRSVNDKMSYIAIGDSIFEAFADQENRGILGRGFGQRMLGSHDASNDNLVSGINCSLSGISTATFNGSDKWRVWIKYCRGAIIELMTNDFGINADINLATAQSRQNTLTDTLAANGCEIMLRTELMPRVSTSNSGIDLNGQTVYNGWDDNQVVETFNEWNQNTLADGRIHGFLPTSTVRSPSNLFKWEPNYAPDGTHPNSTAAAAAANQAVQVRYTFDIMSVRRPENIVAPTISGNPWGGQTLTVANNGTWLYYPLDYDFEWYYNGVEQEGETGNTFVLPDDYEIDDEVYAKVIARNAKGTSKAQSNTKVMVEVPAFIPSDDPGVSRWYTSTDPDMKTGKTSGTLNWIDKITGANPATQATAGRKPASIDDGYGHDIFDFDGVDDRLQDGIPTNICATNNTIIMLIANDTPTKDSRWVNVNNGGSPAWGIESGQFGSNFIQYRSKDNSAAAPNFNAGSSTGYRIIVGRRTGTLLECMFDNTIGTSNGGANSSTSTNMKIGCSGIDDKFADGKIVEIILGPSSFTNAAINQHCNWLVTEYANLGVTWTPLVE